MIRPIITDTGCYLDNHRGHYITRDMIELAIGYGFIIGPFEQFVLSRYDEDYDKGDEYPFEALTELAEEALTWLNCGDNEGLERAIKGQNSPPIIPKGFSWAWSDGDFGLYAYILFTIWDADKSAKLVEDVDMNEAREYLSRKAFVSTVHIEKFLDQSGDDIPLQIGGYTVEANYPSW